MPAPDDRTLLWPPAPASLAEQRAATWFILAAIAGLAAAAPFARLPLAHVPAFVPAYESALAIVELITAILLFGQFARVGTASLLVIATAYLLNTCLVVVHILSFPGVFSDSGLLGAGEQTTAWLYVFRHAGFPVLVIVYAALANSRRDRAPGWPVRRAIPAAVAATLAAASIFTTLSTVGAGLLPVVIIGGDYTVMTETGISPAILAVTGAAIVALWRRRRASVLDSWLFVVLWMWFCDVALSALIGSSRFDLGWYGSRVFGMLAASLVLVSLLIESQRLYAQLATALKAAEAQNAELVQSRSDLARAQRMDAVFQLTGGIAHDFNNLLTAIVFALDMIARNPADGERVVRLAGHAQKAADRGARLVRQMMTFARVQNLMLAVLNPNSVLLEFESFADRAAGERVGIALALDQAVHPVRVDVTEFQAAILNLVNNARDAMPSGGTVRVESRNVRLDASDTKSHPDVMPGGYVMIAVSDTGLGMSREVQAKAFEPFFTTKQVGAGTGLGLSQVLGFAKSAGGHVTIDSEPGVGTTLKLYLPQSVEVQHPASPTPDEAVLLRPAIKGESVLVVEDDSQVMATTSESLQELGYTVLMAETATTALDLLRQQRRIDILFSDVVMPGGMNGVELAAAARRLRPGLRVLLTSGYTGSALQAHGLPADLTVLDKPYRREELANKLRIVLGGG